MDEFSVSGAETLGVGVDVEGHGIAGFVDEGDAVDAEVETNQLIVCGASESDNDVRFCVERWDSNRHAARAAAGKDGC